VVQVGVIFPLVPLEALLHPLAASINKATKANAATAMGIILFFI
jgi:hypothetical protein